MIHLRGFINSADLPTFEDLRYQKELMVTREMLVMVPVSLKSNIKICKIAIEGSSAFAGGLCQINRTQNVNKTKTQTTNSIKYEHTEHIRGVRLLHTEGVVYCNLT